MAQLGGAMQEPMKSPFHTGLQLTLTQSKVLILPHLEIEILWNRSEHLYVLNTSLRSKIFHFLHAFQIDELPNVVSRLCRGRITWSQVLEKYPKFVQQETVAKDVLKGKGE